MNHKTEAGDLRPTDLSKEPYITFNVRTTSPTTVCKHSRGTLQGGGGGRGRGKGGGEGWNTAVKYTNQELLIVSGIHLS